MTPEERNEALRKANEQMKYYHDNRPSMKVLNSKKVKFGDDNRHFIMAGTISTFLCLLGASTFLGKVSSSVSFFLSTYLRIIFKIFFVYVCVCVCLCLCVCFVCLFLIIHAPPPPPPPSPPLF